MRDCFLLSVIRSTKGFFKRVWVGAYKCFKLTNHAGDNLITLIQRKEEMVERKRSRSFWIYTNKANFNQGDKNEKRKDYCSAHFLWISARI